MIGSLYLVRDAVMVTMNTTGAHYFSNKVRMRDLYGSVKKKKTAATFYVRVSFKSSLLVISGILPASEVPTSPDVTVVFPWLCETMACASYEYERGIH
jgi:hypothetical protein